MYIDGLIITQQSLRHTIPGMVAFVRHCGVWNQKALNDYSKSFSPLINLSIFPDNNIYVHDGHHRIVATLLGGRDFIYPQEYSLSKWTYEEYLEINLAVGWVTPYNPRTHCRKSDFREYKNKVMSLKPKQAVTAILNGGNEYLEPRTMRTFKELIARGVE